MGGGGNSVLHHLLHCFSSSVSWLIFSPNSTYRTMPVQKTATSISLISLANALNDASRITIIQLLQAKQMLTFKELLSNLDCSRSTLTHHLNSLEKARLIQQKQHGSEKYYLCNSYGMNHAIDIFTQLIKGEMFHYCKVLLPSISEIELSTLLISHARSIKCEKVFYK